MLKEEFKKNGFVIIKNVIPAEKIESIRLLLKNEFEKEAATGKKTRRPSGVRMFQVPEIYMLLLSDPITSALKKIFGKNYVTIPDLIPQKDMCGGWHLDCASEIPNSYLLDPDYTFAKCGIYLQDNSNEWGGGVDIVPKHHTYPVTFLGTKVAHQVKSVKNRIGIRVKGKMAETKAGDMLVFDSRLPHRSTHPHLLPTLPGVTLDGNTIRNMPFDKSKLSIYWNVCSTEKEARDFMLNSIRRAKKENDAGRPFPDEKPFTDCIQFNFPESFQTDFVEKAKQLGIKIGCLNQLNLDST